MRKRDGVTLVELVIVLIVVAILAAAAVPIYRSLVSRAYEAEILAGLGAVQTAQRLYHAQEDAWPASKTAVENEAFISADDFDEMAYSDYTDYSVIATGDRPVSRWTNVSGMVPSDFPWSQIQIDGDGDVTRTKVP